MSESTQGLTHGRIKGGEGALLGLWFEKRAIYHDAMSQDGGDLSGQQVSEENRVPFWSYKFEMLVRYPSGEIRWHQGPLESSVTVPVMPRGPSHDLAPTHFQEGSLIEAVVS